jgi:photosystem II stability/assembly factor-like uncharacterized protein
MAKAVVLALFLLLLLPTLTSPALADPDTVQWSKVNIPTQGKPGGWALAPGSDAQHLTMAIDGTLYAYGKGLSYTLYKSTDGGVSWSYLGKIQDAIVDIATAPDSSQIVYYATSSKVYKSTDGGTRFSPLPAPGGADGITIEITSMDITTLGNNLIIAVSTRDTDNGEYGGVYILDEAQLFSNWQDTNIGNYDVYAVAFPPNFTSQRQLMAAASNETHTFITNWNSAGWESVIANAKIDSLVPVSASIAFPSDYDANINPSYFVAIDSGSGQGDVYLLTPMAVPGSSVATDLNIGTAYGLSNVDVTGLALSGATLMAGAASCAEVYFSPDGGSSWQRSAKPPTGQSKTYVVMAQGRTYAATSGIDSAFSYTTNDGITWNQISLIDTTLSDIIDLAPSPEFSQDNTLFMLTNQTGGKDSLWRSESGGTTWERVLSSSLAGIDNIDSVRLPPQYSSDNQTVFLTGTSSGNPAIWKSADNGQAFARQIVPFPIDAWAVANNTALFIGSFDAATNTGLVYYTANNGLTYSEGATAGSKSLNSIALSPDYGNDKTILIGNSDGWVFYSEDNGVSFEPLGQQLPDLISGGSDSNSITVAFDPDYSRNNTVYAASHCKKNLNNSSAIYRFIIGTDTSWESIDSALPGGTIIDQLIVSPDGTLYAANSMTDGGMERCLNPTYPLGPTFETVTRGLDDGAQLFGVWLCANKLWSIDSAHTSLMTYTDSLAQPVTLTAPADGAAGVGTIINYTIKNASLDWEALSGATEYKWQLDDDTDFENVPAGFEGNIGASSVQLPALDPATTYYWRVRATKPVLSHWSDKWAFTTSLGTEAGAPQLESPEAAASGVPVKPVFQWSAIAGADGYELIVSTDPAFGNPTILKTDTYALPTTAWQANIGLNYDTTYYWKVRAVSAESYSPWSAVSAFITEPEPPPASPPPSTDPSTDPTTPNWTEWLMPMGGVLALIFLLTMLTMLITMIILVIKVSKL